MSKALVLLRVIPGKEKQVQKRVLELDDVKECWHVFGEYDLVAIVEKATIEDLGKLIRQEIRSIDDIVKTSTLIIYG